MSERTVVPINYKVIPSGLADPGEGRATEVEVVCGSCDYVFVGRMPLQPRFRRVTCPNCGIVNVIDDIH